MKLRSPYDSDIFRLAVPALGTLIAEPLYVLADTAIVGRLGTQELAGLALASTVLLTAHALSIFLAYSTTAVVSRSLGAGDPQTAARYGTQTLWLALGVGLAMTLLMATAGDTFLRALGGAGDVLTFAKRYLYISLLGFPFLLLVTAAGGIYSGRQNTKTPLYISLSAALANLVIELFLINGLGFGVGASALSTVIAQTVSGSVAAALSLRWSYQHDPHLLPNWSVIGHLFSKGWMLVLRTAALRGALTLSTAIAARGGAAAIGAHQIGLQVWFTYALTLDAIAIAGQSLTGTFLGAGAMDKARAAARRMIELDAIVGVAGTLGIFFGRDLLAQIFSNDQTVIDLTATVLIFVALSQPLNSYVFALDGVFIGAGDNSYLGLTMLVSAAVFVVSAWVADVSIGGLPGLWVALLMLMISRAFWLWRRFRQDQWAR